MLLGILGVAILLCALGAGIYLNCYYPNKFDQQIRDEHPDLWFD